MRISMNAALSLLTEASLAMRRSVPFVRAFPGPLARARRADAPAYSIFRHLQSFPTLVLRDTLFVSSVYLPFLLFY